LHAAPSMLVSRAKGGRIISAGLVAITIGDEQDEKWQGLAACNPGVAGWVSVGSQLPDCCEPLAVSSTV